MIAWSSRILVVILVIFSAAVPARADDPFQSGRPSSVAPALATPGWMAGAVAAVARIQRDLNDAISTRIREINETHSIVALAGVLALSFAYGVLHAAGPGHGKMVVASYLLARRERLANGIVLGGLISLVQGVSAIVIVALLGLALRLGQLEVLGQTGLVEVVSYALIALIGLRMLYQAITVRSHDHHHGHDHGALDLHRHDPGPAHATRRNMLAVAVAAGLTPCASAIIVMLFALANNAFAVGVETALAMSLGMALTVSTIGLASVFARQLMQRLVANPRGSVVLERSLNLGGLTLLVAFASLLFLGAWSRL